MTTTATNGSRTAVCYPPAPRDERSAAASRSRRTSASASVRSFASSRSAWSTSPRALEARGHRVTLADLRFSRRSSTHMRDARARRSSASPRCTRSRPTTCWRSRAACARSRPTCRSSSAGTRPRRIPSRFCAGDVAAVVLDDGERALPRRVRRARARATADDRARPRAARRRRRRSCARDGETGTLALDDVPLPARQHVDAWRRQYACLAHRPVWLVETARGCPFRCSFCSIWQLHARAVRERSIESVCQRLRVGRRSRLRRRRSVLAPPVAQPRAGARAPPPRGSASAGCSCRAASIWWRAIPSCSRRGGRSPRLRHLLRPRGGDRRGAERTSRRTPPSTRRRRASTSRADSGYGVTGNFVIDPAWGEARFRAALGVRRAPPALPGGLHDPDAAAGHRRTSSRCARRCARGAGSHFDMHHLLWEPALGAQRFFELYCETWRRSVLNLSGRKSLWQWLREVDLRNVLFLMRALRRTQRMMDPSHYLRECDSDVAPASSAAPRRRLRRPRLKVPSDRSARVRHHVLERHQLRVAVRKRHPHRREQQRRPIDPEIEPREPLANLLPLRHHRHVVGAGARLCVADVMSKLSRSSAGLPSTKYFCTRPCAVDVRLT